MLVVLAITTNHQYYPELQKGTHRVYPHVLLDHWEATVVQELWILQCSSNHFTKWWIQPVPILVIAEKGSSSTLFSAWLLMKQGSHITLRVTELVFNPFSLCVPSVAEEMSCQNNLVPYNLQVQSKTATQILSAPFFSAIREKNLRKTAKDNFMIK